MYILISSSDFTNFHHCIYYINLLGPSGIFSFFFLLIYFSKYFTLICGHATWITENYQQIIILTTTLCNKTFKPIIIYHLKLVTVLYFYNYNLGFSICHQDIKLPFWLALHQKKVKKKLIV